MTKLPFELVSALGEILLLVIGTSLFSTAGLYLEFLAVGALTGGQLVSGIWLCLCGGVALYFGVYAMGVTELFPRVQRMLTHRVE